ncbi:MAG: hypothetical protein V3U89_06565 [Methylophilaceae bacterium]
MLYKNRNRTARMPFWQSFSTHTIFIICALSGVLYLLAQEFQIMPLPLKKYNLLITHGISSYIFALLFGAVIPTHIKAGWKKKRNKTTGSLMVITMSLLLISGLFLYYGADTREAALWVHWVIGCGLVLLFPIHFIRGRRANYLAMKQKKALKRSNNTIED